MWELVHKEGWALKNWWFWTVVLEKTLESPLGCKEIQPVHLKGNQPWIFIGRTDAEAPIFWPPDEKSWLIRKDPDAGKDWRQEEKGMRGWDGWMASLTQWTWVWASSGSWWWTGRPGVLQSMESQKVGHDRATELNNTKTHSICDMLHTTQHIGVTSRLIDWTATTLWWNGVLNLLVCSSQTLVFYIHLGTNKNSDSYSEGQVSVPIFCISNYCRGDVATALHMKSE